jgi:hypothetical protein
MRKILILITGLAIIYGCYTKIGTVREEDDEFKWGGYSGSKQEDILNKGDTNYYYIERNYYYSYPYRWFRFYYPRSYFFFRYYTPGFGFGWYNWDYWWDPWYYDPWWWSYWHWWHYDPWWYHRYFAFYPFGFYPWYYPWWYRPPYVIIYAGGVYVDDSDRNVTSKPRRFGSTRRGESDRRRYGRGRSSGDEGEGLTTPPPSRTRPVGGTMTSAGNSDNRGKGLRKPGGGRTRKGTGITRTGRGGRTREIGSVRSRPPKVNRGTVRKGRSSSGIRSGSKDRKLSRSFGIRSKRSHGVKISPRRDDDRKSVRTRRSRRR